MKIMKYCINDHGCRGDIVEYQYFSPLDYWLRKTVIERGNVHDVQTYIHSSRTIAVNRFSKAPTRMMARFYVAVPLGLLILCGLRY